MNIIKVKEKEKKEQELKKAAKEKAKKEKEKQKEEAKKKEEASEPKIKELTDDEAKKLEEEIKNKKPSTTNEKESQPSESTTEEKVGMKITFHTSFVVFCNDLLFLKLKWLKISVEFRKTVKMKTRKENLNLMLGMDVIWKTIAGHRLVDTMCNHTYIIKSNTFPHEINTLFSLDNFF